MLLEAIRSQCDTDPQKNNEIGTNHTVIDIT